MVSSTLLRRATLALAAAAALAMLPMACDHNEYEIKLTPERGGTLERRLTAWRQTDKEPTTLAEDELAALARAYPAGVPTTQPGAVAFKARFKGAMPDDVGNSGTYLGIETSLGTAVYYVERFRGQDDIHAEIQSRLKGADELVDLTIGFVKTQVTDQAALAQLVGLLQGDARADLKNLVLYAWMAEAQAELAAELPNAAESRPYLGGPAGQALARAAQYLVDRKYLHADDLPRLFRLTHDDSAKPGALIREMVLRKLALPPGTPTPWLGFLNDPEKLGDAFKDYLKTPPAYKAMLAEWEKNRPTTETESSTQPSPPDPMDVVTNLPLIDLGWTDGSTDDRVSIEMRCTSQPAVSNGQYDAETQTIKWQFAIRPRRTSTAPDETEQRPGNLPRVCYVVFAQADPAFQQAHLPRLLEGKDLAEYCLWHKSLTPDEAAQWDAAVAKLTPDTAETLRAFAFKNRPEDLDYVRQGVNMLIGSPPETQPSGTP